MFVMKKITLLFVFVLFIGFQSVFAWGWAVRDAIRQTSENPTFYLGDQVSFAWDVNSTSWGAAYKKAGIGTTNSSAGMNWQNIIWVDEAGDGSGNNEGIRSSTFTVSSTGTWYYSLWIGFNNTYVGDNGTWSDGNSAWAEGNTSFESSSFTVTALSDPTSQTASAASNTQINLSWAKWNSKNVMVVRRLTSAAASNAPNQGTAYTVGNTLGSGTVVYNGGGTSFNDTGLTPGTDYTYLFYSENYSYYSTGSTATATTTAVSTASDYFRSNATGNWDTVGSWESSDNGSSNWIAATLVPGSSASGITILNGHNITLDTNVSVSNLTINSGGTFTASDTNPRILTISKSASGSSTTLANSGTWANGSGGSTLVFTGAPSSGDAVHAITGTIVFQNLTVNKTGGSSNVGASFGAGTSLTGTLEIGLGGYISTAPPTSFYGANAILKFNQGSGATYNVESSDNSWNSTVIPNYITISSGTVNLNSNRTATGNLLIDGGALVLKNANSTNLTIQGNWTRSSGTFTSNDGTVTLSGTSNGTVDITGGGAMTNLVIAKTGGAKVIMNSSLLTATNLTLNSSSILDVNAAKQLTISTAFINNGTLNLKSADGVGTATIITPATISGSGSTVVEQFVSSTATGATGRNWYISSPLSAATSSTITNATGNNLVYWNGTTWTAAPTEMAVMKGYIAVSPAGNRTIQFTGGNLNTGNQSLTDLPSGFNLVGNPYASYVDFAQATKTGVTNSIWYRSKSSGSYVFQTYNVPANVGANDGTAIIPPMQSFWIKTTSGTNTFGFTNTMRSHQDQSVATNRLKAPTVNTQKLARLEIANGADKDETVVYFNENALNTFDDFDSQKMFNETAGAPELYTLTDNKNLVINGFNAVQLNTEIPLGFRTGIANNTESYTLKASQLQNFGTETELVLIDKDNNNSETLMNEGSEYTFTSGVVNTTNRFSLVFKAKGTTTGKCCFNTFENKVSIQKNDNNQLVVNCDNEALKNASISIFNTAGQKLTEQKLNNSATTINTAFKAGVYLVKLQSEGKTYHVKITI